MIHERTLPLRLERAFALFTDGMTDWWPAEYTWGPAVLDALMLQPREGGRLTERSTLGNEYDFGRVLAWEPPRRLLIAWQISPERVPEPDPAKSSEVELRFEPDGDGTRVELEHRDFERHGDGGERYRELMDSPQGWPYILDRYADAASG